MAKVTVFYLVILCYFTLCNSYSKRSFLPLLGDIGKYLKCHEGSCPPWKCQDDSAVIHGYCCGCPGSHYDNVPVFCTRNLRCPPPQQLCRDYDYMLDCCCTGP